MLIPRLKQAQKATPYLPNSSKASTNCSALVWQIGSKVLKAFQPTRRMRSIVRHPWSKLPMWFGDCLSQPFCAFVPIPKHTSMRRVPECGRGGAARSWSLPCADRQVAAYRQESPSVSGSGQRCLGASLHINPNVLTKPAEAISPSVSSVSAEAHVGEHLPLAALLCEVCVVLHQHQQLLQVLQASERPKPGSGCIIHLKIATCTW